MDISIEVLQQLRESEDKVEFKEARTDYNYNNGKRSLLGYITALANEGGGLLVLGMKDHVPHQVVGTSYFLGKEGQLEQNIYRDLKIRVKIFPLSDKDGKRVLVIEIPSRPFGVVMYHNDVALMRVGDSLTRMSNEMLRKVLLETEPDFSSKICIGLAIEHLDQEVIKLLKTKYALKTNNKNFQNLSHQQLLSDLGLFKSEGYTYAALILLGKKSAIKSFLPQSAINIEYRNSFTIHFDDRETLNGALYKNIDAAWEYLNRRNNGTPFQMGPYIFEVKAFNEEIIREAIVNALVHRDYTREGSIVVKQYPEEMVITNPGGFPIGVNKENILDINSTPRNRLLLDVLLKTGIVESSGQGVDKIFYNTIAEGKGMPDYEQSDLFQVCLRIPGKILDRAFYNFLHNHDMQLVRSDISLQEMLGLEQIRSDGAKAKLVSRVIGSLLEKGLITQKGKTKGTYFIFSKSYFEGEPNLKELSDELILQKINPILQSGDMVSMHQFVDLLEKDLTREQVKSRVYKFVEEGILIKSGKGKGTKYHLKT